jgi:HAE1 family hydrophobic/amphiphilic exporter-1
MRGIRGVADIESSLEKSKPELKVRIDRSRASDLGLNVGPIGTTLRAAVAGEVATTIEDDAGDSWDVRVRLRSDQRRYAEDLLSSTSPPTRTTRTRTRSSSLRAVARAEAGAAPPP